MTRSLFIFTLLAAMLIAQAARAQSEEDVPQSRKHKTEYIFGTGGACFGGFGGPLLSVGPLLDQAGVFMGGGGAGSVNNTFFFGGYGQGLTNGPRFDKVVTSAQTRERLGVDDDARLTFGEGGFWLGVTPNAHKAIHGVFSARFGWGGVGWEDAREQNQFTSTVFVLTPQAGVEFNVMPWMRVSLEASYRQVFGVDLPGLESDDLNGFGGFLAFRFGGFCD